MFKQTVHVAQARCAIRWHSFFKMNKKKKPTGAFTERQPCGKQRVSNQQGLLQTEVLISIKTHYCCYTVHENGLQIVFKTFVFVSIN